VWFCTNSVVILRVNETKALQIRSSCTHNEMVAREEIELIELPTRAFSAADRVF
jgi:hypothetical protein